MDEQNENKETSPNQNTPPELPIVNTPIQPGQSPEKVIQPSEELMKEGAATPDSNSTVPITNPSINNNAQLASPNNNQVQTGNTAVTPSQSASVIPPASSPVSSDSPQAYASPQSYHSANSMELANSTKASHRNLFIVLGVLGILFVFFVGGILILLRQYAPGDPNNTSTWKKYSNQSAGFAATFISKPTIFHLPNGTTSYQSKDSTSTYNYSVDVLNEEGSNTPNASLSQVVSMTTQGLQLILTNFSIVSQTSTSVDGNPAIDLICSGTEKNNSIDYINNEFIQKGNVIYEPITHSSNGSQAPNTKFFFNSFKIL